jgi:hypothetical protein
MTNVFFKPWIGNLYGRNGSVFNQRILILGDSHYADESDLGPINHEQSSNFTTGVLSDYLDPEIQGNWKSTFTKFMNSFVRDDVQSERSHEELWNSVAFFNYLQIPAGATSRQTQHFKYTKEKDRSAFLEVIEELEPDVIISWGNKVWDAIPEDFGYGTYVPSQEYSRFYYKYPFKGRNLKLIGITHPSAAYTSSDWTKIFTELNVNM